MNTSKKTGGNTATTNHSKYMLYISLFKSKLKTWKRGKNNRGTHKNNLTESMKLIHIVGKTQENNAGAQS